MRAVGALGGEECKFLGVGGEERRKSAMRSASLFLSAGPSTPSASRSAGESCRKIGVETSAAAKRELNRDKPAWRSQAATCASAMTGRRGGGRVTGERGGGESGERRGERGVLERAAHRAGGALDCVRQKMMRGFFFRFKFEYGVADFGGLGGDFWCDWQRGGTGGQ